MRVKSFRANDIAEAMRQVRREMGEDAIILSSGETDGGAEVIAAIDGDYQAAPGAKAQPRRKPALDMARIGESLAFHGLPQKLSQRILARLADAASPDDEAALAQAFAACFAFRPLPASAARPILLVGPQGAGKTVSIAKLAARLTLAGQRPAVFGCDVARAGALAQLGAYASLLGLEHSACETPEALRSKLAPIAAGSPILIDTAGCNPFSQADLREAKDLIGASGAEPVLVLAAGMDPLEAIDIAAVFASLGVKRVILSKLDAARRFGAALAAADAAGLALAEASASPYIGNGLHPLDPRALARLVLRNPDEVSDDQALDEARI